MSREQLLLSTEQAKVLDSPTISRPYWGGRTPRWFCRYMMEHGCMSVEGGAFRVNRLSEGFLPIQKTVSTSVLDLPTGNLSVKHSHIEGSLLDISYAQYDQNPKEIVLQPIQTVVKFHTRVQSLYANKHNQLLTQLGLAADVIYENKENLLFNHPEFGLLNNVSPSLHIKEDGPPTPNLLDDMLSRVWKMPDFFVMHMEALQSFHAEANKLGIKLETKQIWGSTFTCWRGLPIFPTNKLYLLTEEEKKNSDKKSYSEKTKYEVDDRHRGESHTSILLCRAGEPKQGIVSLYPKGMEGSKMFPLIEVDFMGLDERSVASYLVSTYAAIAVLTPGAICRADVVI
ncbi:MAG: hypothetical protein OEY49_14820 [Candidatus Heimdallarchaeota archaeon]|nr:hypothetical protein [Candidatus Heimdallarchaeota archaeon]